MMSKNFANVALKLGINYNLCFKCETMIAYLSGKLLEKQATSVIIEVGGVGYEVTIPLSTFYELGEEGADVSLRIYTHVREDTLQLFGFKSERERQLYLKLISVQGIGAKSGISMLSGMSAEEIVTAIRTDNLARLTSIPGVGRKTAERLVIELRDKLNEFTAQTALERAASGAGAQAEAPADAVFDDALSALVNLGYQRNAAEKALKQAIKDGTEISVQKLLRKSLQLLAKG
jgi:Holliday junction DNA helicase RuvA